MSEDKVRYGTIRNQIQQVTLSKAIGAAVEKYDDRPLISSRRTTLSYREAWKRAGRVAGYLDELGLDQGDSVGLMVSNRVEYVTAILGLTRGGFVNIPMNDMLGADEYRHILTDSGAEAAIVDAELFEDLDEVRNDTGVADVVVVGRDARPGDHDYEHIVTDRSRDGYDADVGPGSLLSLQYTGGTTGTPKGVEHTHFGWTMDLYSHLVELDIDRGEKMYFCTPLPHAAGMQLQAGILKGAHAVVDSEFSPPSFLATVAEEQVTWTLMVPTMIYSVLDSDGVRDADLSSLDTIVYGAAPIARDRLSEAIDVFGRVFIQAYGLTEVPLLGTVLPKSDHAEDAGQLLESCGKPATMARVRIADPDDKQDTSALPTGETGEILIRAPYSMVEYHGLPKKTDRTLVDGWVRTGDIGRKDDDGYVYILDRDKDMIISGGMNVYTTTVEDALMNHPDVQQVAVIGIPDEKWGETVHAIVVLAESGAVTETELREFTSDDLANYELPKSIEFRDELPVTPYGKIDKQALREPFWEDHSRNVGGGGEAG